MNPIILEAKEGLALINGTQAMTAQGVVNYLEAEKLAYNSEWIAAMTMEALHGITDAFHPAIHEARGYPGASGCCCKNVGLVGGKPIDDCTRGEDVCKTPIPSVAFHKSMAQAGKCLSYVKEKLEIEMNAATDNPLIFEDGERCRIRW